MSDRLCGATRPPSPFTATFDGERKRVYDDLVAAGPIHRIRLPTGVASWLVTGYDAARAALGDPRLIKGGPGHAPFYDRLPPDIAAGIDTHLLSQDPPDHTRLRRLVSAAFTHRRSERLAPRIQEFADQLLAGLAALDSAAPGAPVDLLAEFAYPLPITVICELLGVPEADRIAFRGWTRPLVMGMYAGFEAYAAAAVEMVTYVRELLESKRQAPSDDLLSALVAAHEGSDRLSRHELTSMVFLLLLAGHETTVNLIANGTRALLTHPGQLAALRAAPDRVGEAVEELLRFDAPLQSAIPTQAATDLEIGGVAVTAGDHVVISLLAANRDPARTPDAADLDLFRPDSGHLSFGHLSFGHGIHHCLGAPLARLEGRIALGSLVARFPALRLAGSAQDLRWTPGLLMNGLDSLPVRLS